MNKIIILTFLSVLAPQACAEMLVIGNIDSEVTTLTKKQVQAIFMGRTHSFPNNQRALPLDELEMREEFYKKLTNRSIKQINAYWARLEFSGRATSPREVDDQQAVIAVIKNSKNAIAYIDSEELVEGDVRVLCVLK